MVKVSHSLVAVGAEGSGVKGLLYFIWAKHLKDGACPSPFAVLPLLGWKKCARNYWGLTGRFLLVGS